LSNVIQMAAKKVQLNDEAYQKLDALQTGKKTERLRHRDSLF